MNIPERYDLQLDTLALKFENSRNLSVGSVPRRKRLDIISLSDKILYNILFGKLSLNFKATSVIYVDQSFEKQQLRRVYT